MTRLWTVTAIVLLASGCNLFTRFSDGKDDPDAAGDVSTPSDMADGGTADASDPGDAAGDAEADACLPEPPLDFCTRQGKNCGVLVGVDNCGTSREVDCGACDSEPCGESEPNVCGCPCLVDDECYIAGEPSPDDPCMVCDPDQAIDAFSVAEGAECDDGNPCSADSVCDPTGVCVATDFEGCDSLTTECQVGSCDQTEMSCVVDVLADGTDCSDDGLACTDDVCRGGDCSHVLAPDTCLIDDVCYADGDPAPGNPCMVCDAATSTDSFTAVSAGTACPDGDGLACTQGECDATGSCSAVLQPGNCVISGSCYADGDRDPNNRCRACDAATSTDSFTPEPNGTPCPDGDNLDCTQGECEGGSCVAEVEGANCLIAGACYADGVTNPANPCQVCDSATATDRWTAASEGQSCPTNLSCTTGSCSGGVCMPSIDPGSCVIGGACYAAGTFDPANECGICDPTQSQTAFTTSGTEGMPCGTGSCTCQMGECLKSNMTPCN